MRVDPKGFYLCWVDQNNELDVLDIATVRDVRNGQYAKKPRVSRSEVKPQNSTINIEAFLRKKFI